MDTVPFSIALTLACLFAEKPWWVAVSIFRADAATFCVAIYFTCRAIIVVLWTTTCTGPIIKSKRRETTYILGTFTCTCVLVKDTWRVTFGVR